MRQNGTVSKEEKERGEAYIGAAPLYLIFLLWHRSTSASTLKEKKETSETSMLDEEEEAK